MTQKSLIRQMHGQILEILLNVFIIFVFKLTEMIKIFVVMWLKNLNNITILLYLHSIKLVGTYKILVNISRIIYSIID